MPDLSHIRNFCIVAHIDHGKTSLSDRLLERTGTLQKRELTGTTLDAMDLERERGITIKMHPVRMNYLAKDGKTYQMNLIDTPGHVDFSYEVTRSLNACEGAILVVDASQGVEAQTVANAMLAMGQGLEIVPIVNKIDLPAADFAGACKQVEDVLAIAMDGAIPVSAKMGIGIEEVLEAVVTRMPPPVSSGDTLRALVFDSHFDSYRGVVTYIRVKDGSVRQGDRVHMMSTGLDYDIKEVGVFSPKATRIDSLSAGEVGYVVANIKEAREVKIGDTMTSKIKPAEEPLPGFKEIQPMVFSGIYPVDGSEYEKLKHSIEKLALNDSSFGFMPESSVALGFGFRCGFLGLLHMEIIQERLSREYEIEIITTYPAVIYKVFLTNGEVVELDNPTKMPDPTQIEHIEEPVIKAHIICPADDLGDIMTLIRDRRGDIVKTDSLDAVRLMLTCRIPLNEIVIDFYDKLKSISHGYASMDYEYDGYYTSDLVRMDILINSEPVDAFSCVVHREKAESRGRQMCKSLVEVVPRQQFAVPVQAALGAKVIARETIGAYRKDVTAKCYGGDISRKRKLLEKQKEGKKKMKQFGKVNIPQEAFMSVLKTSTSSGE